jgi:glycine hydroxymethyltransferase
MNDFLFRGGLHENDPAVAELIQKEHARQMDKLVMIASESYVPLAVREAEGSVFQNIYAEGYPAELMHNQDEETILDASAQMSYYRRNADRRYYKGVEYCNMIEALAQRRGAEAFCPPGMNSEGLYVNVQPLSGAVANLAVYQALVQPGDKVMTLDLLHGGHLSHGSPANITGMRQQIVHYRVNEETEVLDYEEMMDTALRERPKMIIGGFTSYPYAPDWVKFRAIADACGAILLADIAHTAGLAVAGVYPNPVGIAHVTSFTTHKTLMGPRGAIIITTDPEIAKKIDRAIFPGLQGGPHINKIAGMATMFKFAQTEQFKALQRQIAANAVALAKGFEANDMRVVHGGTNTHMVLLDCKSIANHNGVPLMGNISSRILDMFNIVCNRNTIPGDKDASKPSALRFGTTWATQRGLNEADMHEIADVIALVLKSAKPYTRQLKTTIAYNAKVDFDTLIEGIRRINMLVAKAGSDASPTPNSRPHLWSVVEGLSKKGDAPLQAVEVAGKEAGAFLKAVLSVDPSALDAGSRVTATLYGRNHTPIANVTCVHMGQNYLLVVPSAQVTTIVQWLRALSDNYVILNDDDVSQGVPGPVTVTPFGEYRAEI